MFIVQEIIEGEPSTPVLFSERASLAANALFETYMEQNGVVEEPCDQEVKGTIRIAGDDAYSVQMYKVRMRYA